VPELPDITIYVERLAATLGGHTLTGLRIPSPFVVRTFDPPVTALLGHVVRGVARLGKRLVLRFDDELYAVIHLMIAGRLRWKPPGAALPGKLGLVAFDFADGALIFTEASKKKRASLHVVRGAAALADFDRGGLDLFTATPDSFLAALTAENHTIKRALTDPRVLSGIGNAYSDEILHRAAAHPVRWTTRLTDEDFARLYAATRAC
jgi:formamidopyrimidine-DNA glycosylase